MILQELRQRAAGSTIKLRLFLLLGFTYVSAGWAGPLPITCRTIISQPPDLRAEGITELVGDIVLRCTGGVPTLPGQAVPQVNITLSLSNDVTSRIVGPNNLTDALLLIDEPYPSPGTQNPPTIQIPPNAGTQLVCPWGPNSLSCPILGTGNGIGTYSGAIGRPNVFQARKTGTNFVEWDGIPIDPPGTTLDRVIRITNVRAVAFGNGIDRVPILANVQIPGWENVTTKVGEVPPFSLSFTTAPGLTFPQCNTMPVSPSASPSGTTAPSFNLRFSAAFPSVLKTRNAGTTIDNPTATSAQNIPGFLYDTESGFYVPFLTFPDSTPPPGLADFGTRVAAYFTNIPNGMRIYLPTRPSSADGNISLQWVAAGSTDTNPYTPIQSTGFLNAGGKPEAVALLPISSGQTGSALAVWEDLRGNSSQPSQLDIPVFVTSAPNTTPALGTAVVYSSYAPIDADLTGSAIPRFLDFGTGGYYSFATVAACNVASPALGLSQSNVNVNLNAGSVLPWLSMVQLTSNGGPLNLSYAVNGGPWLQATLNTTTTPATLQVTTNAVGLPAATYTGSVTVNATPAATGTQGQRAASSSATAAATVIPVTMTLTGTIPAVPLAGIGNAASYEAGKVAPGEAVVMFGTNFGPANIATLFLVDNAVHNALSSTRVLFDDVPAPVIYTVAGQLSVFAPYSLAGKTSTQVVIEYRGKRSTPLTVPVVATVPGMFTISRTGKGQGAILNQDYKVNGPSNPAPRGSYVQMFATGEGAVSPVLPDGQVVGSTLPKPLAAVQVKIGGRTLKAAYAGGSPTNPAGLLQVNVQIPVDMSPGDAVPVSIIVGGVESQAGVTLAIK